MYRWTPFRRFLFGATASAGTKIPPFVFGATASAGTKNPLGKYNLRFFLFSLFALPAPKNNWVTTKR